MTIRFNWLKRRKPETEGGHFNACLFFEQILANAEKQGLSPEVMAQLRYKAELTQMEIEGDKLRLLGMMRSRR